MGFHLSCCTKKHHWMSNKFYGYTDVEDRSLSYNYLKQIHKLPEKEYEYIKDNDGFHFWDLANCSGAEFKTILKPEEFREFIRLYFIDQLEYRTEYNHFEGTPLTFEQFDGFDTHLRADGRISIVELVEIMKEEKPVTLEWS